MTEKEVKKLLKAYKKLNKVREARSVACSYVKQAIFCIPGEESQEREEIKKRRETEPQEGAGREPKSESESEPRSQTRALSCTATD